jgi:CRISPR-associated protein (TIGR02584 family)
MAPAVASETYFCLRRAGSVVAEISLVVTAGAAELARRLLLGPQGALARVAALEFSESGIGAAAEPVLRMMVLRDSNGRAIEDIRSRADHQAMLASMDKIVKDLTGPDCAPLHASLAGGRKTMSAALALAMSLRARREDQMSHVLAGAAFEQDRELMFPPADLRAPGLADPWGYRDRSEAWAVELVSAPFVRLRTFLPAQFSELTLDRLVAVADERLVELAPPRLCLADASLTTGTMIISLSPLRAAVLALLATSADGVAPSNINLVHLAKLYRHSGATKAVATELVHRLTHDGAENWFREQISRLRTDLRRQLGLDGAARLEIFRFGRRPTSRYRMAPGALSIEMGEIV